MELSNSTTEGLPVALRNAFGEPCAARLAGLDALGVRLRCATHVGRPLATGLHGDPLLLHAEFALPLQQGPAKVSVGLRLREQRPTDDGAALEFTCDFLALRPRARRLLQAFLREQDGRAAGAALRRRDPE